MPKRLTVDYYHELALSRGLEWVGTEPANSSSNTLWRCQKKHEWLAPFNRVSNGHGCPQCAGNAPLTSGDYAAAASARGYFWIDTLPLTTHTKTTWQCQLGHIWKATYANIAHNGNGCPHCAGKARKTEKDYRNAAALLGLTWQGNTLPLKTMDLTRWRCANNHEWEARYNDINRGHSCPLCKGMVNGVVVSQPQLSLHAMTGGIINHRIKPYTVDIAVTVNTLNIAIEYDAWYWHQGNEAHDTKRDAYLISCGWRMLHIKAGVLLPSRNQLDAAIAELVNGANYTEIVLGDWRGDK